MVSLISELQKETLDSSVSVLDILRKALVVSKKLDVEEMKSWIILELNGYKNNDEIPTYRKINGNLKGYNPFHGWQPIMLDEDMTELLSSKEVAQPIGELINIKKRDGKIGIRLSGKLERIIMKGIGAEVPLIYFIDQSQVEGIIETVRNMVLNWTLKLEDDGIIGDGMSFSSDEKQKAQENQYTIKNYFTDQDNLQIQQNTKNSSQVISINDLDMEKIEKIKNMVKNNLKNIDFKNNNDKDEVKNKLEIIEDQLTNNNPKEGVIQKSFNSIKNILKGVTGNIIASGLIHEINSLF